MLQKALLPYPDEVAQVACDPRVSCQGKVELSVVHAAGSFHCFMYLSTFAMETGHFATDGLVTGHSDRISRPFF